MKKRYGVIVEEDVYRSWRGQAAKLNLSIGTWLQEITERSQLMDEEYVRREFPSLTKAESKLNEWPAPKRVSMDEIPLEEPKMQEPVKKAIEPDKPKVDNSGNLRKGLGPLPGESDKTFREFRPVPKPGKK